MIRGRWANPHNTSFSVSPDNCIYNDVALILREMQKRCIQLIPFYEYFPFRLLPSQHHFKQANEKIHRIVRRLFQERRGTPRDNTGMIHSITQT